MDNPELAAQIEELINLLLPVPPVDTACHPGAKVREAEAIQESTELAAQAKKFRSMQAYLAWRGNVQNNEKNL